MAEWLCYTLCPQSSQISDNIFSQCVSKQVIVKVKVVPGKKGKELEPRKDSNWLESNEEQF